MRFLPLSALALLLACSGGGGSGADAGGPDEADGDLAGETAAGDAAFDFEPGSDDGPGPTDLGDVDPEVLDDLCADLAASLVDDCPPGSFPGSLGSFESDCAEDAKTDLRLLAGYWCFGAACDVGLCGTGTDAIATAPACEPLCAAADVCDALDVFELPEDEPGVCVAACSGALAGAPELEDAIPCAEAAFADGCDVTTAGECLGAEGEPDLADSPLAGIWELLAVSSGGAPREPVPPGSHKVFRGDGQYQGQCGTVPSGTWTYDPGTMVVTVQLFGSGTLAWPVVELGEETLVLENGEDDEHYGRSSCER